MDFDYVSLVQGRTEKGAMGQDCREAVLPFVVKSVDTEKQRVTGIASSETIDRDGEIITIAALRKAIKGYMKNPVVLACHTHRTATGHSPTVGKVVEYQFKGKSLWVTVEFAKTELGEEYWTLYRDKVQRAFSIGFRATEPPKEEVIDGKRVPVYTEIELYEISCVPVPSNRDALTKAKRRKMDFVNQKRAERSGLPFGDDRADEFAKAFLLDIYDCEDGEEEKAAGENPRPDTVWDAWQHKETVLCRQFGNQQLYQRYKKYHDQKMKGNIYKHEFSAEELELFADVEERGAAAAMHKLKTGYYDEDDETDELKGLVLRKHHHP